MKKIIISVITMLLIAINISFINVVYADDLETLTQTTKANEIMVQETISQDVKLNQPITTVSASSESLKQNENNEDIEIGYVMIFFCVAILCGTVAGSYLFRK